MAENEHKKDTAVHSDPTCCSSSNETSDPSSVASLWAAIERLPTYTRLRTSLLTRSEDDKRMAHTSTVDVTKLGALERHVFSDDMIKIIDQDNLHFLSKLKERLDRVDLKLPTTEIRYDNLSVEAESEVDHKYGPPTLWTSVKNTYHATFDCCKRQSQKNKRTVLKHISGIIKPSRLTLLLGPPGSGKTTFLQALAARLDPSLKVTTGDISYNGCNLDELVPHKTSAYISQHDLHIPEITVRETLDFAAQCQGTGSREDIMRELIRREKRTGIQPDSVVDTYMKATSVKGLKRSLQTDYILKILGLDTCADSLVGSPLKRGVSGGEKKRLTTGEMIVGPVRALLMDEISNGLDSSTTFQIITCLQQLAHITDFTILVSLLQPAPETFDLFDDIILMAEGKVIYHGSRDNIVDFFKLCGFTCPPRKGLADFLQEVVSVRDQAQYWHHKDRPHSYISADNFAKSFTEFHLGQNLAAQLSAPFRKTESHDKALSHKMYSLGNWEMLRVCMSREWLLMKRNSFVHVFKSVQLVVVGVITMTVFIRTRMKIDEVHANYYLGSLFYGLIRLVCNSLAELSLTTARLNVFCKQRDMHFYPAWAYTIPAVILRIPFSILDAILWTSLTYYVIGYSPEPERFFRQLLLLFAMHQVSMSWFRFIASAVRHPSVAASCGLFSLLSMLLFGGFIIKKPSLPAWLGWGFWLSPLSYAEIATSITEFQAPRWQQKMVPSSHTSLGTLVLVRRGLDFSDYFYWVCIAALIGFWLLLNIGFCCALNFAKAPRRLKTVKSHGTHLESTTTATSGNKISGLVLPFEPATISFEDVQYFVKTPKKRRQLLKDVTGSFRPGVLTALMGVTGAGKTTLMDVLSGRKTCGVTEGEIKINRYPKVQSVYSRISAYCEQTDIHSPLITIEESLKYSACLRLPSCVDEKTKIDFVAQVIEMVELDDIKDALVGTPGLTGLSTEQRKRLTIAVELVSNPSIIFMDEPTSGLDARAAAIVMRTVKKIVSTKRTVVCTIHQPSIDIFDAFDELFLMKPGGQVIYSGALGQNGCNMIRYFEGICTVPKIRADCNPATWMLEITSPSTEARLGLDFAQLYKESHLCRENKELVKNLRVMPQTLEKLHFPNGWVQFKACLWKHHLSYWRSPQYNLVRLVYIACTSLLIGALLWKKGQNM
uniref:ABC transporter domain-containing protein n=1 Tax=Kalanchoe fedtschenkoi TaxID=63787 RepID=A0A7N0VKM0_KALFE